MNKVMNFFKGRTVSFYLKVAIAVLLVIPSVYMGMRIPVQHKYIWPLICVLLGLAAEVLAIIFEDKKYGDYIELAGVIIISAEFGLFMSSSILDIVDYVYGINFWGDASQFPFVVLYGSILGVGTLISIVLCFLKKKTDTEN